MTPELGTCDVVRVGIAEGAVSRAPHRLRTTGLGSCVGIVLFDPVSTVAGLVHIMLPSAPDDAQVPMKYADSGIAWLFDALVREGAAVHRVRAKIAGGAQMFVSVGKNDLMRIGPRNVEAVESKLADMRIELVAKDVGGNTGRTIEFDPVTSVLQIRTAAQGSYDI